MTQPRARGRGPYVGVSQCSPNARTTTNANIPPPKRAGAWVESVRAAERRINAVAIATARRISPAFSRSTTYASSKNELPGRLGSKFVAGFANIVRYGFTFRLQSLVMMSVMWAPKTKSRTAAARNGAGGRSRDHAGRAERCIGY